MCLYQKTQQISSPSYNEFKLDTPGVTNGNGLESVRCRARSCPSISDSLLCYCGTKYCSNFCRRRSTMRHSRTPNIPSQGYHMAVLYPVFLRPYHPLTPFSRQSFILDASQPISSCNIAERKSTYL
ncbi:hypothetical protein TNCV_2173101 [Trichonephila clavipes]|nr:hypothetical protein TNCV_2173101 [Trichonephila clavipes]